MLGLKRSARGKSCVLPLPYINCLCNLINARYTDVERVNHNFTRLRVNAI